jgi:hypothetical protein
VIPLPRLRPRLRLAVLLVAVGFVAAIVGTLAACKEGPRAGATSPTPTPAPSIAPGTTPIPIALGGTALGAVLTPGAQVVYAFVTNTNGLEVHLDVDAESIHPATNKLDARLTVFAPNGSLLASAEDGKTVLDPHAMKDPFLAVLTGSAGTYTVVVDDQTGAGGATGYAFVLRATVAHPVPLQGGNVCSDAVTLTNFEMTISGSTTGASDTCCGPAVLPCVGSAVPGPDRTYKAFLASGQTIQIVRTGRAFDGAVYVTASCSSSSTVVVQQSCMVGGDGRDDADGVDFTPATTGTYFLFVDGVTGTSGAYELDLHRL